METNYADDLEERIGNLLSSVNIDFVHESQDKEQMLDFYLPTYGIYIEVKKFHSDRVNNQLKSKDNIILIQGIKGIEFLEKILN